MKILNDYMNLPQVKFMIENWLVFVIIFVIVAAVLLIKAKITSGYIQIINCPTCFTFWEKGTKVCKTCGESLE